MALLQKQSSLSLPPRVNTPKTAACRGKFPFDAAGVFVRLPRVSRSLFSSRRRAGRRRDVLGKATHVTTAQYHPCRQKPRRR